MSIKNNKSQKKAGKSWKFKLSVTVVILFCLILLVCGLILLYYMATVPDLEDLKPSPIAQTSKVYAIDGSLLTEFHATENREIIPFNKMSQNIKNAVIAVEDKRFYEHEGVDYKRIIGALIVDIRTGSYAQGASTITQQYVKNVYFGHEKTLRRKINEAIIAIQLEKNYTKDKILEMYLNTVYFGAGAYGVEKASQIYFGVSANDLSISQAALLAGLLRAPEVYSPFNNIEKAKERRNVVLSLMKEQNFITDKEYKEAINEPIILNIYSVNSGSTENRFAPYFIDFVKQQLYEKKFTDYDVFKGGLRIYTTLDKDLQVKAENAFKKVFMEPIEPSYSLVNIDPSNGYIYALVGGKDYSVSQFNIATQGKRQPGSVFKVPVLMEAINQHIPPETTFNPNGPITIDIPGSKPWVVDNFGGEKFGDQMNIIDATIHSVNVVYAQLTMQVGADNIEKLLNKMDIKDIGNNPAIGLGGLEKGITPLDVSKIFSTLASGGIYHEPVCITKITDSDGKILYEYDPQKNPSTKEVMGKPEALLVTQILQRVITEGTGKNANIGRPAAGKTGTTSDFRDAWFAGYTPELVTVVWMGNQENNKPMNPINNTAVTGGAFPAKVWKEFMSEALKDKPISQFEVPGDSLTEVQICKDSGMLPTFWCPQESLTYKIYSKDNIPTEYCNIHNKITVPELTGLSADEARQILTSLFFNINESLEYSDEFAPQTIVRTDPPAGTVIETVDNINPQITIFISQGAQTIKMPNLIGQNKDTAEEILSSLGLTISNIVYDFSSTQPADLIFNQDPAPDAEITQTTPITLYISKGVNPSGSVPNVIGLNKTAAVNTLNNEGFFNIIINEEQSNLPKETVINQSPAPGTSYDKNKSITILVSKGVLVPNVIGMTKEKAIKSLTDYGFKIEIIKDSESNKGKVVFQSPEANTFVDFGSKISLKIEAEDEQTTTSTTTSTTESPSSSSQTSTLTSTSTSEQLQQ